MRRTSRGQWDGAQRRGRSRGRGPEPGPEPKSSVVGDALGQGAARRRLAGSGRAGIEAKERLLGETDADPAEGLGLPVRGAVVDQGQRGQLGASRPGSARPGPARPGSRSIRRGRYSRGLRLRRSGDRTRTSGSSRGASPADRPRRGRSRSRAGSGTRPGPSPGAGRGSGRPGRRRLDRRAEAIRRAAATEQDPAVGGPRQVVDRQSIGRHDLPGAPADRGPFGVRDRLGQDDQGVQRQERSMELVELAQVGLAGEHDRARSNLAVRRPQAPAEGAAVHPVRRRSRRFVRRSCRPVARRPGPGRERACPDGPRRTGCRRSSRAHPRSGSVRPSRRHRAGDSPRPGPTARGSANGHRGPAPARGHERP